MDWYMSAVLTVIAVCQVYLALRSHATVSTSVVKLAYGEQETMKVELVGITEPRMAGRQWDAIQVKIEPE